MSKRDRKNGVPATATSIPLVDPHAMPDNPSIGDLVKDATAQMSTLVRAEVELARAEVTRDVKKGLTGSVYFILALVVLLYSTFFMFFFLAELLDTWLWRWAAFLIVFLLMLAVTAIFALLGYRKVRRIRGPQQTIESVKETTAALSPGLSKFGGSSGRTGSTPPAPATAIPASSPEWTGGARITTMPGSAGGAAGSTGGAAGAIETPKATGSTPSAEVTATPRAVGSTKAIARTEPETASAAIITDIDSDSASTDTTAVITDTVVTGNPEPVRLTSESGYDATAAVWAESGRPTSKFDPPLDDRLPGGRSGW